MKKLAAVLVIALVASLSNAALLEWEAIPATVDVNYGPFGTITHNALEIKVYNNSPDMYLKSFDTDWVSDVALYVGGNTWDPNNGTTSFSFAETDILAAPGWTERDSAHLQAAFTIPDINLAIDPGASATLAYLVADLDGTFAPLAISVDDITVTETTNPAGLPKGVLTDAQGANATDPIDIEMVPEPATMALLGLGGVAALIRRRK
jgi:hypothetical protein